jgi:hypothetical protein
MAQFLVPCFLILRKQPKALAFYPHIVPDADAAFKVCVGIIVYGAGNFKSNKNKVDKDCLMKYIKTYKTYKYYM